MIDKEKIKVEIERLKESGCASPIVICDTLLAFIDSLQEEPVSEDKCNGCNNAKGCVTCVDWSEWAHYEEPVSEELETEIEWYMTNVYSGNTYIEDVARHFANWQKQQMMKDAEEAEVWDENPPHITYFPKNLKGGDKVKLIIIKQEKE